jgi:hypothetical protein
MLREFAIFAVVSNITLYWLYLQDKLVMVGWGMGRIDI